MVLASKELLRKANMLNPELHNKCHNKTQAAYHPASDPQVLFILHYFPHPPQEIPKQSAGSNGETVPDRDCDFEERDPRVQIR